MAPPSWDPMAPANEIYTALALYVINMPGGTVADLRWWWNDEKGRRKDAGLTEEQTQLLVEACKAKVEEIEGRSRPALPVAPSQQQPVRPAPRAAPAPARPAARKPAARKPQLSLI